VKLSDAEISALSRFKALPEAAFIEAFTRLTSDRKGLAVKDKPNGECVFLEGDSCSVQAAKPQQCRDFPNLWRLPDFQKSCAAMPRMVSDARYRQLVAHATGREESKVPVPTTPDPT
jgi:Fe-S-cluster containining protein